ncbi:PAH-inducible cytochrome P450 monooxygenase PC-PAH 1 [Amylocystis lapponica]|nr:PAH-inducible cytochrome P450 monooxygenase PC-PAH 1 [Amylocystis lapponica]
MMNVVLVFIALVVFAAVVAYRTISRRTLKDVRGPASPSFVFGHMMMLNHQKEVGEYDDQFVPLYGTAWRTKECWGKDVLTLTDPKALQHIYHKSGYNYPKTVVARYITRQITGDGILFAEGQDHNRNRRIMNPAFTAGQLRTFLPLFRRVAAKLSQKWRDVLQTATTEAEQVINVHSWLGRTTLDVIGEGTCCKYDAHYVRVLLECPLRSRDSLLYPSKMTILFRSLWKYIPDRLLRLIVYLPGREYRRLRHTLLVINRISRQLIEEKTEACLSGKDENRKDIMSILVKANMSENPKTRLTNTEMIAQMATFLFAGHETTASSTTWLLWELAKHPEVQDKIRHEISAIRARVSARGDADFQVSDFDAMTYTIAVIKESLRLHPIVPTLVREASRDDVIPLEFPVTSTTGEVISEIPVTKGQLISAQAGVGPGRRSFNPDRFLEEKGRSTSVGVLANILACTGAGIRACIGVLEMQALLVELLENFEFGIPSDKPDIIRLPSGLMIPMIRGKIHLGSQMPLKVTVIQ